VNNDRTGCELNMPRSRKSISYVSHVTVSEVGIAICYSHFAICCSNTDVEHGPGVPLSALLMPGHKVLIEQNTFHANRRVVQNDVKGEDFTDNQQSTGLRKIVKSRFVAGAPTRELVAGWVLRQ
jgi:hypothetical protein